MPALSIFSTHPLHPQVTEALSALGDYKVASAPTPDAILAESGGAELIVVRAPIPPSVIEREKALRALVRHGAGLDMIPVDIATRAGVLVANVPGANAVTVAEHAIWSALALLRRYPEVNRDLCDNGWSAGRSHADGGRELSGKTIGVLGMGNVGRQIARIAHNGFSMKVISHTRRPDGIPDEVQAVSFSELLETSDVLVLCCPLTDATRGLIDARALQSMRRGAILINVARGPVVVEEALLKALGSGHLGGAAIDVFDTQPLPPGHAFFDLPNVVLTPHMAGITEESMLRMGEGVVTEARLIAEGELPVQLVNPDAVERYRERFA
ncbi:MAG: dehydrogenase [Rhizobiaceae bacterium MnEN-MB40S]|nr:MAG: dehydrogenase [Rhizobiaceae bacterium MnEN-MB40S]